MKQLLFSFFFFVFSLLSLNAATVRGIIFDDTSNQPLDYVNISLLNAENSQVIDGGFSDIDGLFKLNAPIGKYIFEATYVGYKTYTKSVTVSSEADIIKLGRIVLLEDAQAIAELEVVGQKSGMRLEIDKTVFDVDQNVLADGATASEVLANIPSVDVDSEGNVSLRNNSSVELWINGKPSGLSGTDKGEVMDMLPAETIKSVELITNPSSKHSAEGSVGIINIVMKESEKAGYFGNVSVGAAYREGNKYPAGNLGFNINYSSKKIDFYINAATRYKNMSKQSYTNRANFSDVNDTTYLNQLNSDFKQRASAFARAGLTYHIDEKNDIGLSAFGVYGKSGSKTVKEYTNLDQAFDTTNIAYRNTNGEMDMGLYSISVDYKHMFEKDNHEISANANYFGFIRNSSNQYDNIIADITTTQYQKVYGNDNSVYAQVDYFNKLTKDSKVEAGLRGDYKFNNSLDQTFDASWVEDMTKHNPFVYNEQVYAAYLNYAHKFNWFGMQLGLRGEQTITNANDEHRSYFQLFPSAYFSFTLPKSNELQLNYTRRIQRPRGRIINSFVDRSDPLNIVYGNAMLMPEFANNVEINYLKNWELHTISASIFYSYKENIIQKVSSLNASGVMESTWANCTYSQNAGVSLNVKNRLFNNYLDLSTSASAYYEQLGENAEYNIKRSDDFVWDVKVNANVKIIDNLSVQVSGMYKSPHLIAQGTKSDKYSLDFGLRASFLNKSLVLSVSVKDILNSKTHDITTTYGDNFYQESANTSSGRNYRIALSYNFGNLGKKGKKANRQSGGAESSFDSMGDDF